jgi:SSS family transporter
MPLVIDALIILAYFVVIISIGLYMGRRENSLHDFALGGRKVPWWAVMASIIAAETSAATFLGTPGEGYKSQSLAYVQLFLGLMIGRILVGYVFLKPYYTYKVYTVYDFLGVRFGPWSKNYVSALFLLMRTLASGTRMFVPSLVMVGAWRLMRPNASSSNLLTEYVVAIAIITLITCLYTAIGGIKAVIWTDVVQACVMFGSALVAIAVLLNDIGGSIPAGLRVLGNEAPQLKGYTGYFRTGFESDAVANYMQAHHVSQMTTWSYLLMILQSEYTLFSAIIASTVASMAAFGTDQDMVQRMLTAQGYRESRRSLVMSALMDLPIASAFCLIGVLLWVFYRHQPEHLPVDASGKPVIADVFSNYILYVLPTGIRGLVLAGVFATAMGSLSAALNALATSATNDWYIPYFARHRDESVHVSAAQGFTAVFAVLMIVIAGAFAYAKVHNPALRIIPVVLGIAGFILGPMLGVFLIGMLTRSRGSDEGNMLAITLGLIATIALWFAGVIAFTWFALVGAAVVVVVGIFFKTPIEVLERATRQAELAHAEEDVPLALRS